MILAPPSVIREVVPPLLPLCGLHDLPARRALQSEDHLHSHCLLTFIVSTSVLNSSNVHHIMVVHISREYQLRCTPCECGV